jgi:hypothetical protein
VAVGRAVRLRAQIAGNAIQPRAEHPFVAIALALPGHDGQ